jgi:Na+-transporting methylmalonyl-CoA/oxaloacetate decarboxylase gamma subunit
MLIAESLWRTKMVEVLRITLIGMGLVFGAMALVLGTMLLLARIRDPQPAEEAAGEASEPEPPEADERAARLRVAAIAAAVARARSQTPAASGAASATGAPNPWTALHRNRQLNSAPRKRT